MLSRRRFVQAGGIGLGGAVGLPVRFGVPPEITVVTVRGV